MNFRLLLFVASFIGVVICSGQRYSENGTTVDPDLSEIPKRFEVRGDNAATQFKKYMSKINDLAREANVTVKYKVKVEVKKPEKRKIKWNQSKSKRYNIPLKKKSMKLSNFELVMRKHVEAAPSRAHNDEQMLAATTEKQPVVFTTKFLWDGKYKPVLTQVKTNYTKIVKPVRNKIITLTV